MAGDYGRAGALKAQKGLGIKSSQYRAFSPLDIEESLVGSELEEYQSALKQLAQPAQTERSGVVKKKYLRRQEQAMDAASRLRELAASRAFGDFSAAAMQYSKPWLVQRPEEGLIKGQTVAYGLARQPLASISFAGEGMRAAPLPGAGALMGEHTFRPIGYEAAKQIKRGKRLSDIPYKGMSFSAPTPTSTVGTFPQIDLGNLNLNFGRY